PSWDQVFAQSSFGIVTKAGFWLTPEPEAMTTMRLKLSEPEDIGWFVDAMTPHIISGRIPHRISAPSYTGSATMASQRREWYEGRDALPDSVVGSIIERYDAGWWNPRIQLYGLPEVNAINAATIEAAVAPFTDNRFEHSEWRKGEPGGRPRPSVFPLQIVNWHGGRGGHLDFSPILPADGRLVLEQLERTRRRYTEFGVDYSATFYLCGRHVININLMLYDKDDDELTGRTRELFEVLVRDAAEAGYNEYRTHISYMDDVAATFDFNDGALAKLNATVKDALDPRGILAPGKSGIWPARYRGPRNGGSGE
ncbi:MAG: FAD-linked oxidase C-terminal domain-containing protein, partial [Gammaproteobacteria bacterium]